MGAYRGVKQESRRFGANVTEGQLCAVSDSDGLSLAPLLLYMQSRYMNPHAAQLFPFNISVLKIPLAAFKNKASTLPGACIIVVKSCVAVDSYF